MKMTKKRLIINLSLTLAIVILTCVKLVRWFSEPPIIGYDKETWTVLAATAYFGPYAAALLTIVSIWLFGKAKKVLCIISCIVSGLLFLHELFCFSLIARLFLWADAKIPYTGFDPLITLGILIVLGITTSLAVMDKN